MGLWVSERRRAVFDFVVEVLLIAVGVFLGLLANSWQEGRQHRALAERTLRNFVAELQTNQRNVEEERSYHETLRRELENFLARPVRNEEEFQRVVHFTGVHPVSFERTAWDLALATQALSYLKPDTALAISKVYTQQNSFQALENSFIVVAYNSSTDPDPTRLASATFMYLGDVNVQEPQLLDR